MHMEKILTDMKYGLGDLMDEIRKIDIPRIRFTTSHPRDFDDHLIEVLAKGGNLDESYPFTCSIRINGSVKNYGS